MLGLLSTVPGCSLFSSGDCPLRGAAGEPILERLTALHFFIPDCKQENRPRLRFGCVLSSVSNAGLNSGSSWVWLCL